MYGVKTRILDRTVEDTRLLVKGALELVDDIESYHENGDIITAKTGFRFGLLTSSYGESLVIALDPRDDETTAVTVRGEKNVSVNVGANPDKYILEFLQTLDTLSEYSIANVIDVLDENTREQTKEVYSADAQVDGTSALTVVLGLILFFTFLSIVFI